MAQQIVTSLIDDIDGSEATGTIEFTVAGVSYRLDVNDKNAAKFDKALAPFIEHAQRVGGRAKRGTVTRIESNASAIRAWAESNGIEMSPRGRISRDIRDQFAAAQAS